MNKIKISHEVPLCMLEESVNFNDYHYALVHLFEKYPKYYEFFKSRLEVGEEVLLDNSIFELKEAFSCEQFTYWVNELKPTRYIIPDVLDDPKATLAQIDNWNENFKHRVEGSAIGVVQGISYNQRTKCYLEMVDKVDEIAICFPHSWHDSSTTNEDGFKTRMLQRVQLIYNWIRDGVIRDDKRHHLLGCLLPQEFSYYKNLDFIYSLDTSNPIIHGMYNVKYDNGALNNKIHKKMADSMEDELNKTQMKSIYYNIKEFKKNLV